MISTLTFLFSLWLIPLAAPQFPLISSGEERLGSCTDTKLGNNIGAVYPEPATSDGELAINLREESMRMYSVGDILYAGSNPIVRIFSYRVVCRSSSSSNTGYSNSVTVLAFYSCNGIACTRNSGIANDGVARNYTTLFSLFCTPDLLRWSVQNAVEPTAIGFGGGNNRSPTNSFPNPQIAEDGKCSVCTSDQDDAAKFPTSYDRATGCVSCPSPCQSGTQTCLTTVTSTSTVATSSCCAFLQVPGDQCVRTCPPPYFVINQDNCQQKVLLQIEDTGDTSIRLCPGDTVTYTCQSVFLGDTARLVWDVTVPGQETERVIYSDASQLGVLSETSDLRVTLTSYDVGGLLTSTLSLVVNLNSIFETEVSCTVDSLSPEIEIVQYSSHDEVPPAPTGFRVAQQFQISLSTTIVTFMWDQGTNDGIRYELAASPNPLVSVMNGTLRSPYNVTLVPFKIHSASLFAINCVGRSLPSTIQVDVESPARFVINEDTGELSTAYVQVIADNGDVAPNISCVATSLVAILTWAKEGVADLPAGITETVVVPHTKQVVRLGWMDKMHFADSGRYTCTISDRGQGDAIIGIDLLVRYSPVITSVYPKIPFITPVTSTSFTVPVGYTGVVITCNAIGWPPPTLMWLSGSAQVIQPKFSHSSDLESSGYSSIQLEFPTGISGSDSGSYSCIVRGVGTQATQTDSATITLQVTSGKIPIDTTPQCLLDSFTVYFQLQVLGTCEYEEQDAIEEVVIEIRDFLIGGIISQCTECVISDEAILISYGPLCSNSKSGATLFKGEISTADAGLTQSIFCGLTAWYQSIPLIRINNELKLVDQDCTLEVESLDSSKSCISNLLIEEYVIGIVVILPVTLVGVIIVSTLLVVILMACYKRVHSHVNQKKRLDPRRKSMYQEEDFPENYDPFAQDFKPEGRRSMYDDEVTVINQYNEKFKLGDHVEDDSKTVEDDCKTVDETVVNEFNASYRDGGDDYTTQQDDSTTQQDDYTTVHDNSTNRSSRRKRGKKDKTLQPGDDATQRGSDRSSRRSQKRSKSSKSLHDDSTTQQGDDYTTAYDGNSTQYDGNTTQYDYTTQNDDYSTQQDNYKTQLKDYMTLQVDDNATLRSSDRSSSRSPKRSRSSKSVRDDSTARGSDRSSRRSPKRSRSSKNLRDDSTTRGSDRSSKRSPKRSKSSKSLHDDSTTQQGDYTTQQSDYTTQQDDYTTQQDDYTTQHTLQPEDNTTLRGSERSSQRGSDHSSRRRRGKKDDTLQQGDDTSQQGSDHSSRSPKRNKSSKSVCDDSNTQQIPGDYTTQQDDYTTQRDDSTTQQGDDSTTQQGDGNNTTQHYPTRQVDDDTTQRGSERSSRRKQRRKDKTPSGDDTTLRGSDRSSSRRREKTSQEGDDATQQSRSSRRSPKSSKSLHDDSTTLQGDDDYKTVQQDDYTTQQDDYTTQQDDYTTQHDYKTIQDDDTTQQDDYTTQHDYKTIQDDYTTQQDDYTTQHDYKTIQDDYTTQQDDYTTQHDYKTQQDDYTTQQDDYTTQGDYTTQQGDDYATQQDYKTVQDDSLTQQDYKTVQDDSLTQQDEYKTQYDDHSTQGGDSTRDR